MALKPRHIPERTCVVCREKKPKKDLTRVVRTPDGQVLIDQSGRMDGRGAYICSNPADWVEAVSKGKLARALNVAISPGARDALLGHARQLESDDSIRSSGATAQ